MTRTIACLSPLTEQQVRELAGTEDVKVLVAPEPPAPQAVREIVADADVVIADMTHRHRLDREALAAMPRCRLVQQPAVGFDVIDHLAAAELGIPVANAAGFNADTVADWTLMGILNAVRYGARLDREMRAGGWRPAAALQPRDMRALTVGIVGMGNIGRQVAARVAAFGSRILYYDVVACDLPDCHPVPFDELLERSDVVTLHLPLYAGSTALIGAEQLARMRPGAILCNASRGPIVDEAALIEALESGHLGGAALDVFEVEPLAADSPLRHMENVFVTPHIAGWSEQARANLMEQTGANVRRVLAGDKPVNVVNGL
jgi:phosphoglycerate dehydrogenase-like enzyme